MSIIRNGALVASQSCCSLTENSIGNNYTISVTLGNYLVGASTDHYIEFNNISGLTFPNDYSYILVQFDSRYILTASTYQCFIKNSFTLITNLLCTRNTTTSILISNFNTSTIISNISFTLGIQNINTPITLSLLQLSLSTLDVGYNVI